MLGPLTIGCNQHPFSENFLQQAIGLEGRDTAICVFPLEGDEAYIRLFVAAPDLLAACKALLKNYVNQMYHGDWKCIHCKRTDKLFTDIPHTDDCPVVLAQAAIAAADTPGG